MLMASYNHEEYVGQAITSVIAQTSPDWELIIVDDCSTDGTWDVITSFDDPRITCARMEQNSRACAAYNRALASSTGQIVMTLDSDDAYERDKIARQVEFFDQHPGVAVLGTHITTTPFSADVQEWFNTDADINDPAQWVWINRLAHSSVAVRRDVYDSLGGLREDLVRTPDWELWLRALTAGYTFAVLPEQLAQIRVDAGSVTHSDPTATIAEYVGISADYWQSHLHDRSTMQARVANVRIALERFGDLPGDGADRVRGHLASLLAQVPDELTRIFQDDRELIAAKDEVIAAQDEVVRVRGEHLDEAALVLQERFDVIQRLHAELAVAEQTIGDLQHLQSSPKAQLQALGRSVPQSVRRRLRSPKTDGAP